MNATRQDAWSQDEDVLLAEIVLRHIREGKTQLEAFEEVAKRLSRTSAACGFRWNATVRKQYKKAIQMAKEERKTSVPEPLKQASGQYPQLNLQSISFDEAISVLAKMKESLVSNRSVANTEEQIASLEEENKVLREQLQRYEEAWEEIGKLWDWVQTS